MLLCKGHKCQYRKVCSRYVLGIAHERVSNLPAMVADEYKKNKWIDHCLNAKKFIRIGSTGNTVDGRKIS